MNVSSRAELSASRADPETMCVVHGWVLLREGAQWASSSTSRITPPGTGSGTKTRGERRERMISVIVDMDVNLPCSAPVVLQAGARPSFDIHTHEKAKSA
ncbi:hypothetical protein GCM10009551_019110 [Nocardiopsis tropica]